MVTYGQLSLTANLYIQGTASKSREHFKGAMIDLETRNIDEAGISLGTRMFPSEAKDD